MTGSESTPPGEGSIYLAQAGPLDRQKRQSGRVARWCYAAGFARGSAYASSVVWLSTAEPNRVGDGLSSVPFTVRVCRYGFDSPVRSRLVRPATFPRHGVSVLRRRRRS